VKAAEGPYRDGSKYVPTGFKEFFRRGEAEGFVMGVYAFLLSTPAKAQADHFLRAIEAVGGPEDKILMVDFEEYQAPHGYLTPGNDQLMTFIAEVKRRVGDHPVVLYSGRGFWNGGDSSGDFEQYGADVAWDAMYLDMTPHDRPRDYYADVKHRGWGEPWGGVEPWFWQFTSAGNVAGLNIDVNAYRGTREQLFALTGVKEGGGIGDGGTGAGGGGKRVLTHGGIEYEPEPVEGFTDEDFKEIGREVLKLFSRIRHNRTRRRGP
jgi:GH25 family lysozyme M1 (1,4-beta-N-acetylmuramidase)